MSSVTRIEKGGDSHTGSVAQEPTQPIFRTLLEESIWRQIHTPSERPETYSLHSRYLQSLSEPTNDGLEVFQKVFSKESPFVPLIKRIIGSYIPVEARPLMSTSIPYRNFFISPFAVNVDLSRRDVLKNYLGKRYQSDCHVVIAASISKSIYEIPPRAVPGPYGMTFCMYPEVFAYALQLLQKDNEKEKTIALEIGAASGEHSALFAFTEVDQVYMNEINRGEIEKFEQLKKNLPKDINKKLQVFEGSCLDLLERKPHLINQVDLVLCRNVIHFFNSKEQSQLFHVLKQVLKPGGRAIFTANATSAMEKGKKVFKKHPEATCFHLTQCVIRDLSRVQVRCKNVFYRVSLCPMSLFSNECQELRLYERDSAHSSKWQVYNDNFNKISSKELQTKIQKAIQKKMDHMKTIKKGTVVVWVRKVWAFNEESLSRLFKMAGFEIETTFFIGGQGHLIQELNEFNSKQNVGIVFRKPLNLSPKKVSVDFQVLRV